MQRWAARRKLGRAVSDRLEKLLALHRDAPGDDFTTYAIALEHASAGDAAEALRWLEETVRLAPDHAYARYQMARLHAEEGRDAEARRALEEGLAAAERSGDAKASGELRELAEELGAA